MLVLHWDYTDNNNAIADQFFDSIETHRQLIVAIVKQVIVMQFCRSARLAPVSCQWLVPVDQQNWIAFIMVPHIQCAQILFCSFGIDLS